MRIPDVLLPAGEDVRWRKLIREQFPILSHHKMPATIPAPPGASELPAGDPVDDLAEIAQAISECLRRWENMGENQALSYFRSSYQEHWGTHLRNLQLYLHTHC